MNPHTLGSRPAPRHRAEIARRTGRGLIALGIVITAGFSGVLAGPVAGPAAADPAPAPATFTRTTTGAYSGTVPDGACFVDARVTGGAGGHNMVGSGVSQPGANGAAARISARFSVTPGEAFSGVVGGGGAQDRVGGSNGGGAGGTATPTSGITHQGGGGGGWTSLVLDGDDAVVAGGGGGSGGGHSLDQGGGGDAGLPTGPGVTIGQTGTNGRDLNAATIVGGGVGGGTTAPGAGGVNSATPARNGSSGVGRTGGTAGPDANPDSGGGGGGGWFGGGGAASSTDNGSGGLTAGGVTGAGGGGGSSFVAALSADGSGTPVSGVAAVPAGERPTAGAGQDGDVALAFVPCAYDLVVTKSVDDDSPVPGQTITWTVGVTNEGPDPMSRGDLLTLDDTVPGPGPTSVTSVAVSGGANDRGLTRPPLTCDLSAGQPMPTSVTCSRPYGDAAATSPDAGARGLDPGETVVITYTQVVPAATAAGTTITNVATVTDRSPSGNNTATETVTVLAGPPVATDDAAETPFETPVDLPATGNDAPGDPGTPLVPAQTVFTSPQATGGGKTLVTPQGTWQVNGDGTVTFTPADGYTGTTPPVEYQVTDAAGGTDTATLVVTVRPGPSALPDQDTTPQDVTVVLDPPALLNDTPSQQADGSAGSFDASTLVFTAGGTPGGTVTQGGKTLTVPGEGVFTIGAGGEVTFDPEPQFTGTTTPAAYTVTDSAGNQTGSTISIVVEPVDPVANDDAASTPFDTPVTLPAVTDDDAGAPSAPLVPSATVFTSAQAVNGGKTLTTPEGTWQVNGDGTVTFTPVPGYVGTTPAVEYRISDDNGTTDTALLTVTVRPGPQATADSDETPQDVDVTVDPLGNDTPGLLADGTPGSWDETSVVFSSGANPGTVGDGGKTLTVPGEGVYTIDPTTGAVTFDPEPQFTGVATPVTYTVTDSNGNDAGSTITITVTPIDPVANDDTASTPFGTPVTLPAVTDDDAGAPSAPLVPSATVFTSAQAVNGGKTLTTPEGTWQVNGDGTVTFTPAPGFTGLTAPVEYQITDDNGTTDTALLTVQVDEGPLAEPDVDETPQDVDLTVDVVDNDTPGTNETFDPTTVLFSSEGSPGTVGDGGKTLTVPGEGVYTIDPTTGAVTFDPEPQFTGQATSVTYVVTDTAGNDATSTLTITVTPVDPVANDDAASTPFDTPVTLPAVTDDDAGAPSAPLVPSATVFTSAQAVNGGKTLTTPEGTWQVNGDGTVTFTPVPGYVGTTPAVEYRISDDNGTTDTALLTVTVRPGPQATADSDETPQDVDVTVDPLGNDTPGLLADGTPGSWDETSVVFSSGANPGTVGDGGKTLTVPGEGVYTIDPTTGAVTFDPEPQFTGVATPVTYTVTDSNGNDAGSTITITVTPIDPVANDDTASTPFGTPVTLPAVTDDDAGAPSAPLVPSATVFTSAQAVNGGKTLTTPEGTWQVNGDGTVTFTPAPGFTGLTAPVEYQITDDNGTTDTALLTVTVRPGPQAEPDTGTTPQNTDVTVPLLPNDTPGEQADGTPGTFDPTTVVFTSPDATDGGLSLVVPGEGTYTIDPTTGAVTFDPEPQFTGTATPVDYEVTDSLGNPTGSTLTITVTPITPRAVKDKDKTPYETPVVVDVLGNDTPGDPGVPLDPTTLRLLDPATGDPVTEVVVPGEGVWTIVNGTVRFVPEDGFVGPATPVGYVVADANGTEVTSTVRVVVGPPGKALPDETVTTPGTPVTVPVLADDQAAPGEQLIPTSVCLLPGTASGKAGAGGKGGAAAGTAKARCLTSHTLASVGTWTVNPDGTITFTPVLGYTGTATIDYSVRDTGGNVYTATLDVAVEREEPVPPVADGTGGDGSPGGLPDTGGPASVWLPLGVGAVLLGLTLVVFGRRRRAQHA